MPSKRHFLSVLLLGLAACTTQDSSQTVAYTGARIIVGDGVRVFENGVLVSDNGTLTAVGDADTPVPDGAEVVDLTGKTVIPTLINVHGHVGYLRGAETSADLYSRDNVLDHLRRSMYYGVGVVQSLGTDRVGTEIEIRNQQRSGELDDPGLAMLFTSGDGIVAPTPGAPNGGPFFATDVVFEASTANQGRVAVQALAAVDADAVKIWVDDRGGTRAKTTPEVYGAVIDEAHARGLLAIAHVYYLDDAKGLVEAGVDGFAHMVRAEPGADPDLIRAVRRDGIFQCSTMTIQKRFVDPPSWIDDPALAETVSAEAIDQWRAELASATDEARERSRVGYRRLETTLLRMYQGGVNIVLCGDTGLLSQAPGFTEHRELEAIVQAGVPPIHGIRIATSAGAEVLGLADRGELEVGKRADFIVLDANPLEDISNSRRIADVVVLGRAIERSR